MGADANSVGPDVTRAHICVNLFIISVNLQSRVDKPDTFRHLYGMWFRMNPLVGLSNVKTSLHHPVFIRSAAKAQCCSVTDHRPIPASHSTGAAVSSSPQQHHQHHPSTSSSTSANDVSSMSTDPTLTDTDSSLETAGPAAAAATASGPMGCCRWLSPTPGSGLGHTTWSHPRPPARHRPLDPPAVFASPPCSSSVV